MSGRLQDADPPFKLDNDVRYIMLIDRGPRECLHLVNSPNTAACCAHRGAAVRSVCSGSRFWCTADASKTLRGAAESPGVKPCKFALKVWNAQQAGAIGVRRPIISPPASVEQRCEGPKEAFSPVLDPDTLSTH